MDAAAALQLAQALVQQYPYEALGVAFVLLFGVTWLVGRSQNARLASKWLRLLGSEDGVLARNFAWVPSPDKPNSTWQDSPVCFRAYASGRRYCTGAMLTVVTRERQDLFYQLWGLLFPAEDSLEVEVMLNEATPCPPTVLLVGAPRATKALLKDNPGIANYARPLTVSKDRTTTWSTDHARGWSVMAEHAHFFYDLLNTEPAIAKALGLRWFRSALITSEDVRDSAVDASSSSSSGSGSGSGDGQGDGSSGSGGRNGKPPHVALRFTFALPPESAAHEVQQMLAAVFMLVDLVATYKVQPEMRKRAQELRAKLQQEAAKRRSDTRQGELAAKRAERIEAERAKARAAGPQALAKFEARMQRQMREKEMRKRVVRG